MSEWQPIETAPKDGTRILAWSSEYGQRETRMTMYGKGSPGYAKWARGEGPAESGWNWQEPQNNWASNWHPTHWKVLCAPPQTASAA